MECRISISVVHEIMFVFHTRQDSVTHVGFSFDVTYVATGDMAGLIQVWKPSEPEPVWNEKIDELQACKANFVLASFLNCEFYFL